MSPCCPISLLQTTSTKDTLLSDFVMATLFDHEFNLPKQARYHQSAGKILAQKLLRFRSLNPIILSISKGSVVLADIVAHLLNSPLDILLTEKINHSQETSLGAITEEGVSVLNEEVIKKLGLKTREVKALVKQKHNELKKQMATFRNGQALPQMRNRTVILVSDCIDSESLAQAAIATVRKHLPQLVILATPKCRKTHQQKLWQQSDDFVTLSLGETSSAPILPVSDSLVANILNTHRYHIH